MIVSIIIRCKNEDSSIGGTLQKIFDQQIDIQFEVIVVDSGSTDHTIEIVQQYPVHLFQIPADDFSFGYALNYGIERAEGSVIVNLSAHCLPADGRWLSELTAPIINGMADASYGRQIPVRGVNPYEEVSLAKHFPDGEKKSGRVPFSNANCAFIRKMWKEVKFDPALPSWEDYLWHLQLRDRYRFRYCPKASVYHSHPFSIEGIRRRSYNDGRAFRIFKNNYGIDLFENGGRTSGEKIKMFFADIRNHMKFFRENGYIRYIFSVPLVRFLAYKAYLDGYNSR